ncbi:MAG: hypothetical protein OEX80_07310 [Candidatus Aminicenantes bacterium]|nr:hypothetical protein [Candidatus Aminicenantes bacterium]
MKKYGLPIITIFLVVLATGLYGETGQQPRWNISLSGDIILPEEVFDLGIDIAVGYNLTRLVGLEGDLNINFIHGVYFLSGGVVLGNSAVKKRILSPYVLGGLVCGGISGEGGGSGGMLGGGIKILHKESMVRFDLRFYFFPGVIWKKLSIGYIWTFD